MWLQANLWTPSRYREREGPRPSPSHPMGNKPMSRIFFRIYFGYRHRRQQCAPNDHPSGAGPGTVGIVPPPPEAGQRFSAFRAKLEIDLDKKPNQDAFRLLAHFILGRGGNNVINPLAEAVTLRLGTFTAAIPPGSFERQGSGPFIFQGRINGVALEVSIKPTRTKRYTLTAAGREANLTEAKNPVPVILTIGTTAARLWSRPKLTNLVALGALWRGALADQLF